MQCSQCLRQNEPGLDFCDYCGEPLLHVRPAPAPSPPRSGAATQRGRPVHVNDWAMANAAGAAVTVGKTFAFVGRGLLDTPSLAWLKPFLEPSAIRSTIIPLIGTAPIQLPGCRIDPTKPLAIDAAVVTSDKALYREGSDTVNLLVVDPFGGDREVQLEVELDGARLTARPLQLTHGVATAALGDLPAGSYEVFLSDAEDDQPACRFIVAAYKLSALVASMERQALEGDRLRVVLRLTAFGTPVTGEVDLELFDDGKRVTRERVTATDGIASTAFTLTGQGPHSINVQLVNDPGRTASVPIVGSRAIDRVDTVFSTVGAEVLASALPSDDAREVRGLWLRRGASASAPVVLDRVDTRRARLTAATAIERIMVLVCDPAVPGARDGVPDARTLTHPALIDPQYALGEQQFGAGGYAESLATFLAARERTVTTSALAHPNYSYFIACCHARLGNVTAGIAALRQSISDGWYDFEHLRADEDLAGLRNDPAFETIANRGIRTITRSLAADETLEIDVPSPVGLLAIGALVEGVPWEGHATIITPSALSLAIETPPAPRPGGTLEVAVTANTTGPVYVIVKDARLLSTDTPTSMLASRLKAFATSASNLLGKGKPTTRLSELLPPPQPPANSYARVPGGKRGSSFGSPPDFDDPFAPPTGARAMRPMAAAMPSAMPSMAPRPPASPPSKGRAAFQSAPDEGAAGVPLPQAASSGPPASPPRVIDEAPELLFAGLVPTIAGRATLSVQLPEVFADYVIEAFAVDGAEWSGATARVRAELTHFATLELPAFVHPSDTAIGRLTAGCGAAGMTVTVTRDGAAVPLLSNNAPLAANAALAGPRAELTFLVGPGDYVATVTDRATGAAIATMKRVDMPGNLRRLARSVRFLRRGEKVALADDPSIVTLRALPGLDKPFRLLCDATADYGHACCEQTAAKILAACSMYLFASDDKRRRDKAEEIILAGVRREQSMWLRGRGFKMYPEASPEPNTYWGPPTARYLWNLDLLRASQPSRALVRAVDDALEMAADATRAYRLQWPPAPDKPETAYSAMRFGNEPDRNSAFAVARRFAESAVATAAAPRNAVAFRADAAYAAATLLCSGNDATVPAALQLANRVVADIGSEGRLYSTVDSIGAIALMAELQAARIIGGGHALLDGKRIPVGNAAAYGEAGEIAADDATVAVEVTRIIEESWSKFANAVPVTVMLKNRGRTTARATIGDALDLEVRLDDGYKTGDLVWVALPDALSRVVGGGQVKRFSIDPAGSSSVSIPLAATALTLDRDGREGSQRFAVIVRNMFEEERAGNPGFLDVTVAAPRR